MNEEETMFIEEPSSADLKLEIARLHARVCELANNWSAAVRDCERYKKIALLAASKDHEYWWRDLKETLINAGLTVEE